MLDPQVQRCEVGHAVLGFQVQRRELGHAVLDFRKGMPDIPGPMAAIRPGAHPDLDSYDPNRQYSLRDLAAVTNVGRSAIGHYVKRGLLPRAEPRGPYTRYTEDHRIRLLAIARLRERGYGLNQMAEALDGASLDDIFRVAGYEPPPDEAPSAPAAGVAPAVTPAAGTKEPAPASTHTDPAPAPVEEPKGAYRWHAARKRRHWESVAICPGVFLVVLADADTEARRVAREIEATYGGEK